MSERLLPGLVFAALSAICFALAAPFTRLAIAGHVVPVDAVAARAMFAFIALSGFILIARRGFKIARDAWPSLIGLGIATSVLSLAYLSSVAFIPVGLAVIIFFTFPLIILLLSPLIEKTPFGIGRFLIGLVALAGLYLALGPTIGDIDWRGIVLAAIGACGAAGQIFFARAAAMRVQGETIVWASHLIIVPATLAVSLVFGGDKFAPSGMSNILPVGIIAVSVICVGYLAGYLFQVRALAFARASHVAPAYNVEPIVSTALAAYMFGERLVDLQYFGGALVLIALILSNLLHLKRS